MDQVKCIECGTPTRARWQVCHRPGCNKARQVAIKNARVKEVAALKARVAELEEEGNAKTAG